jgi:hypothetical protein
MILALYSQLSHVFSAHDFPFFMSVQHNSSMCIALSTHFGCCLCLCVILILASCCYFGRFQGMFSHDRACHYLLSYFDQYKLMCELDVICMGCSINND